MLGRRLDALTGLSGARAPLGGGCPVGWRAAGEREGQDGTEKGAGPRTGLKH